MNAAVIVDNRPSKRLNEIIDQHMGFLTGWECIRVHDHPIRNPHDYNRILTSYDFWHHLRRYDRVLIFQHDSGMLKEIEDEFFEYDYIGAPWKEGAPWAREDRAGGNGGLSLRNPHAMMYVISKEPYNSSMGNEDVYFTHRLQNPAPFEVCRKFSVENRICARYCRMACNR